MPHYVYLCKDCKKEFEKVMHMDELHKKKVECPHCGSTKVELEVKSFSAVTSKKS